MYALCVSGTVKHARLRAEVFFYSLYIFFFIPSIIHESSWAPQIDRNGKYSHRIQAHSSSSCSGLDSFRALQVLLVECCFTSTETVGLLGTGAQDVHLDFHTAPELRKFCSDVFKR